MNATQFKAVMGHPPEQDDLERANCKAAGTIGHQGCGVCRHGKPVFTCHDCYVAACQTTKPCAQLGHT